MKKVLIIFSVLLLTISCKKEVHQNENEIIEENLEPKLNFEIINSSKSEFYYTENTGGSIMVSYQTHFSHFQNITIKNNSDTAFNQFNLNSEITVTFENGETFTEEGFGRTDTSISIKD